MEFRSFAAALCAWTAVCAELSFAQPQIDDVKGRALDYATHQIRPMASSADGAYLYVVNQPGSRLAVFEHPGLARVADVPLSPGLVSVAERVPGEVWLVDAVQHSISIVDVATRTIQRTIRVGAEPHGLIFTPDKSRAYVACSAAQRVDVIDALSKSLVQSIAIPALNPRALEWLNGRVWVASFRSGNNTAPMGRNDSDGVDDIVAVRSLSDFPELRQLPDHDLFSITTQASVGGDALDREMHRGIGTILLGLTARPGTSELWVPNTEALNAVYKGERAFPAGQVVSNRVTIQDVATGAKTIVDLDALAPTGAECAQPANVSFTADGSRAFVTGYNSDRIAVLDVDPGGNVSWAGHIDVRPGQAYPEGAGPRATLVSNDGTTLYVFSKVDNGLIAVPLAALPSTTPFAFTAEPPVDIGFTPVTGRELRGRFLFVNAKFSKSGTSSCASCHVDATSDGIAWDLSAFLDPEDTPKSELQFGVDVKGPLVTQNTLRLGETAPYHWRGEKKALIEFNEAFKNLLENQVDGEPATIGGSFQYISAYMRHLPIPANPRQELDRSLTEEQMRGKDLFETAPSFHGIACVDCHQLPLGTSGELVAFKVGGASKTGVVPHLRGVADDIAPPFQIGGDFGERTEVGAGLLHGGASSGILDMLLMADPDRPGEPLFDLTPAEASDVAAYLRAFDTGLAPSTTVQVTAHPGNWDGEALEVLEFLIAQAEAGHCEVVCRRAPIGTPPLTVHRSLLYDPQSDKFQPASRAAATVAPDVLLAEASTGATVTFLGVPGHSGLQMALDRDIDGMWDLDERNAGTDPENPDVDEDGFPDGYEVLWGLDPFVPDATSPDAVAPALVGAPRLIYRTQTAIKFEIETDEHTRVHVRVNGTLVDRLPLETGFDHQFSIVLAELQPGVSNRVDLELLDPAQNQRVETFFWETRPRVLEEPVRVTSIRPRILAAATGGLRELHVAVHLGRGGAPTSSGYEVLASVYHRRASDDGLTLITTRMQQLADGQNGRVALRTPLPTLAQLGGTGTLLITVQDVTAPLGAPLYVEALDAVGTVELAY